MIRWIWTFWRIKNVDEDRRNHSLSSERLETKEPITKSPSSPYVNKVPPNPIWSPWVPTPHPMSCQTWGINQGLYYLLSPISLVWGNGNVPTRTFTMAYKTLLPSNGIESPIFLSLPTWILRRGAGRRRTERQLLRKDPFRIFGNFEKASKKGGKPQHRA